MASVNISPVGNSKYFVGIYPVPFRVENNDKLVGGYPNPLDMRKQW